MARVFHDGFELGRPRYTTHSTERYDGGLWLVRTGTGHASDQWCGVTTSKRSGVYGLYMTGYTTWTTAYCHARHVFPSAINEHYGRVFFHKGKLLTNSDFIRLRSASGNIIQFRAITSNDRLIIYCLGVAIYDEEFVLPNTVWKKIEWHLKVDPVDGIFECKIDGVLVVSYVGDTQGTHMGFRELMLYMENAGFNSGNNTQFYFDDVAINDTEGTVNNSWVGQGAILLLKPKAQGDFSQFSPSNITLENWEMVKDAPMDSDSTYNASDTLESIDSYVTQGVVTDLGLAPVEGISRVKAIQTIVTARWENDVGDLLSFLRVNGVDSEGAQHIINSGYDRGWAHMFNINPFTGQAWTFQDTENLQVGIKHKARV